MRLWRSRASSPLLKRKRGSVILLRPRRWCRSRLDIRGNRAEESIGTVDRYLDQALHGGLKSVRIIHGKGTGALRTAIHEMLRGHPLVRRYRTAPAREGGDGATVVELAQ